MQSGRTRYRVVPAPLLAAVLVWSWAASAFADDHIRGMITGLGAGGTVFVQTDAATLLVAVSNATDIHRLDGIRPVRASAAELIPGLRVRVDGEYATGGKFIAEKVTFTKEDFRTAAAIQSGLLSTNQPSAANEQHVAATSGALAATDPRVSSLDGFTPLRSITVYFGDGKYAVSRDQKAQLQQLARDAQGVHGYMIQVAAYASDVGPESSNQKLSMERANAVTAILRQSGVPLSNVIVPATMGVSEQVAHNTTSKGQAPNRRAVVTLLQNKGIAQ